MKDKLLELTRGHDKAIVDLQKRVGRYTGNQVQADTLLAAVQAAASTWFDSVRPALEAAGFSSEYVDRGNFAFDTLLRVGKRHPTKKVLLNAIGEVVKLYRDMIHVIETSSFKTDGGGLSITPYIEGLPSDEGEYLDEAQRCLSVNGLRACVVLGWCAAIARIHAKIEELDYDTFNNATVEMAGKTTGRFKPFNKRYSIASRSELQTIFDTDLLWILEYLGLIDNNQHQRMRHCFEFRNNSAHPGLAPIKGENLYSFYSDISEIILKNDKFALEPKVAG